MVMTSTPFVECADCFMLFHVFKFRISGAEGLFQASLRRVRFPAAPQAAVDDVLADGVSPQLGCPDLLPPTVIA
jgi:hypothetical protein